LWNRRHELTSDPQLEPDLENGIATDLLELAAVRADLLAGVEGRVGEADQVLEEAERSFGSHFALSIRRAQNRGDLAQSPVPRTPWEHYDLGRYLLRRGEFGAAAAEFHAALQGRPSDFWSNFYEGLCRYRLKHWSEAEAAFRVCVALSPKSAAAHYNQALALQALGRANEARAAYDRALKLDPTLVEARLNRGSLAYQQQRFTDALTDFERALADAPERATRGRLHLNAALAERAMGNHAAAATHVRQAADLGVEENASPRVGDR
jgi:tetratricopeptide (TPR) repeat protein